jgi:ParB/RepB/Spo0J family partition protein
MSILTTTPAPASEDPNSRVVHEIHTDDLMFGPGNPPITLESLSDILPSLEKNGQQTPGILYSNPNSPPRYIVAAGNRRAMGCRILGRKFKAFILTGPIDMAELIKIRLTENVIRRTMSQDQIAADINEYMNLKGVSQAEAAEAFGLSPGYVSKLLSVSKRLSPELNHLRDNPDICRDNLRIIASMSTPDLQKKLADEVIARGGKVKRDVLEILATKLRCSVTGNKPSVHKLSQGGVSVALPGDWGWEHIIEWFSTQLKRARTAAERKDPLSVFGTL